MATVVRSKMQQEQAVQLFAPLRLPDTTADINAVWASHGTGDGLSAWVDHLLSAALGKTGTGVVHLEGNRDAVRYAIEVAGDSVEANSNSAVALPGRRAAVTLSVGAEGAHALADSWCPGLSLGLAAPADGPVVALVRRPGGDVLLASSVALPAAARKLIDQLPEAPLPAPAQTQQDATSEVIRQPSGLAMIVGLAGLSVVAIGIAALSALTGGSPAPASAPIVPGPSVAALGPPARPLADRPPVADGVIAADPATGLVVLMGCCDGGGSRAGNVSTWTWDGQHWTHVPSRGSAPAFQRGLHLAYDDAISAFILEGGDQASSTWIWAAGSWAEGQPGLQPPLGAAAMAYDPVIRRLVLVVPDPADQLAQTWAWDGELWTQIDAGGPALNNPAALAFDPGTQQLVLAGQNGFDTQVTAWTLTPLHTWRFDRVVTGFTYDPTMQLSWDGASGRLLAVSLGPDAVPVNGSTLPVDTWAWDGRTWSQQSPAAAPTEQGLLVSTASHHILFVGIDETWGVPDVWAWTGTNWTRGWTARLSPAPGATP